MLDERQKLIPPSLSGANPNSKILWWLNLKDLIVFAITMILGLAISVGICFATNNWIYLLIFLFFIGLAILLTAKVDNNLSIWYFLFAYFNYLIKPKQTQSLQQEKANSNFSAFLSNNNKTYIYQVVGLNINNFSYENILMLEKQLTYLFNVADICLYKLDIPFDLQTHQNYLMQTTTNLLQKTYLDNLKTNNLNDYPLQEQFLVIQNANEYNLKKFHEIKAILASQNIHLKELNQYQHNLVQQKIYETKNKQWISKWSYLKNDKNNQFISYLTINQLPIIVNPNWLSELLNLNDVSIKINIGSLPNKIAIKKINQSLLVLNSQLKKVNLKPVETQNLINQIEALENLNNAFVSEQQTIKVFDILIKIHANDLNSLIKTKRKIIGYLQARKFQVTTLFGKQEQAFYDFMPIINKKLKERPFNLSSDTLAFGHPFANGSCIEQNGWFVGIDNNNYPVFLNLTQTTAEKENNNLVIIGASGSGKTTFLKNAIGLNLMTDQNKIIIIDPDRQFENLASKYQAEIVDVTNNKQFSINPFYLWPEQSIQSKLESLCGFFDIIFSDSLSPNQIKHLINVAFEWYTQNFDQIKTTNHQLTFSLFYQLISQTESIDAETKWNVLQFTKSKQYGHLWDGDNVFNINGNLIIFDIKNLVQGSTTFKAQIYLILDYIEFIILNNMNNTKNISLVVDEAHLFLSTQTMQALCKLQNFCKRVRKYNAALLVGTQNLNDFTKESIKGEATALINNSATLIAMKLKPDDINNLDTLLQGTLTEEEKHHLATAIQGQALMLRGNKRFNLRFTRMVN